MDENVFDCCIKYLKVLQAGRVKPDSKGSGEQGVVYDSLDNFPDIQATKNKINDMLKLDIKKHETEIKNDRPRRSH